MKLSRVCVIIFVFMPSALLHPHGFGNSTYVNTYDNHQQKIHLLCTRSLRTKTKVASYNTHSHKYSRHAIKRCGQSKTNCYIRLMFNNDHSSNDIICTPTQEFYCTQTNEWIPAYQLHPGDELLSLGGKTQLATYVEPVKKPIVVYTIEVDHCHTFFVGRHNVLTHNMALPIAWVTWLNIPLGVVIGGTGSFFGPVTCGVSCVLAGAFAIAWHAAFHSQIPHYRIATRDMIDFERQPNYTGCVVQPPLPAQHSCNHADQNPYNPAYFTCDPCLLSSIKDVPTLSCGNSQMHSADDRPIKHTCNHTNQNPHNQEYNTCSTGSIIEPIAPAVLAHLYAQQNVTSAKNPSSTRYDGPWARNWKEFFDTCPVGQQYKHLFEDIRKQNPKDGAPLRRILEDVPETTMFKKGNILAPDRAHAGDHLEVWDVNGNWIGVANLDGSKNEQKSNAAQNKGNRRIKL